MTDKPHPRIQEIAMPTGGTPATGEHFQHDADLAHDAALALKADVHDPHAPVDEGTFKNQRELTAHLQGFEHAERRRRLDNFFAAEFNILTRHGLEGALSTEVIKQRGTRYEDSRRGKDQPSVPQGYIVMFADVDGLKPVNDRLGHPAGDRLIVGAGEAIRRATRFSSDIVAHLSGDEFLVVMPVGDQETATMVMEESLRNHKGEETSGVLEKLKQRSSELRNSLRKDYPDFPEDDALRERGKMPGRISAGYHYFSATDFLARYEEFRSSPNPEKSFAQFLGREAEEKMYEMKRGQAT